MKKFTAIILTLIIACLAFTACSKKGSEIPVDTDTATETALPEAAIPGSALPEAFTALMNAIVEVKAGSAGTSLRAEEAAKTLVEYAYANSTGSDSGAFEVLTKGWFTTADISVDDFRLCFEATVDAVPEEDMTDVAVLNVINGITAALDSMKPAEAEKTAGAVSEDRQYTSLEELNKVFGSNLCKPAVMGVSDEEYEVKTVNGIKVAEYEFSVNGVEYEFRASDSTEDIIGINEDGDSEYPDSNDKPAFKQTAEHFMAWWLAGDIQYAIITDADEIEYETFKGIVEEMVNSVKA